MGMFNFVLDSIKGEIFDFKVKRRVFVASTVQDKCYFVRFALPHISVSSAVL